MFSFSRILASALLQKYKIWQWGLLVLTLCSPFSTHASNIPDIQVLMQQLGIRQQDLVSLEQGKTVSFNIAENHEKQLAVGVAIYLSATPAKFIEFTKHGGMESIETEVTTQSLIPPYATLEAFKEFSLEPWHRETARFLAVRSGYLFNLSTRELQYLQATRPVQADLASQIYREILFKRWQAYRKNGLKGIAPYDRGSGEIAEPGKELFLTTLNNKILTSYFPELHEAWINYPAALPVGADERFFLTNRQVEDRPTATLIHRIMLTADTTGIVLSRLFYVGHSYNSSQLTLIYSPYRDGLLLFYINQTATDQLTGFGSSIKRTFGREQMRIRMDRHLRNLNNTLKEK